MKYKARCYYCGSDILTKNREEICNVKMSDNLIEYIDGSYFKELCPSCKKEIKITTPCIIKNRYKNYYVVLTPKTDDAIAAAKAEIEIQKGERPIDRFRIVHNSSDLAEKISIFQNNLNDTTIEIVKAVLSFMYLIQADKIIDKIAYQGDDPEDGDIQYFRILFKGEIEEIVVNFNMAKFYEILPKELPVIFDDEYYVSTKQAIEYLQSDRDFQMLFTSYE